MSKMIDAVGAANTWIGKIEEMMDCGLLIDDAAQCANSLHELSEVAEGISQELFDRIATRGKK